MRPVPKSARAAASRRRREYSGNPATTLPGWSPKARTCRRVRSSAPPTSDCGCSSARRCRSSPPSAPRPAPRSPSCGLVPGAVRAGCSTPSASRPLPRLSRPEPHLPRHLLAALRLGRAGHGHLRPRGRVPPGRRPSRSSSTSSVRRPIATLRSTNCSTASGRQHHVVPTVLDGRGAPRAGRERPGRDVDRAVRGRRRPSPPPAAPATRRHAPAGSVAAHRS